MTARTDWPLVLALWAAGLGAAAQFGKISVIFAPLGAVYPGAGAAFLVSLVGMTGIVLGTTAGIVVQRIGFRRVLIAALALGAALSAFQAALPPMPWMIASRLVEGLSHLAIVVAAPTLIAQVTAPRDQGMAMTLWASFFGVSFMVTAWAGLPLVAAAGPGALFAAHGLYMAAMAGLLWWRLPRGLVPGTAALPGPRAVLAEHAAIYRSPRIAAPALGFVFYTLIFIAVLTLAPTLVEGPARTFLAGAMPLASIVVSLTLGVLALRAMSAVGLAVTGFVLGAAITLAIGVTGVAHPAFVWLCVGLAAALGLVQGASFAAIPQVNAAPGDRARAAGAIAQLGNVGTTAGTPILVLIIGAVGAGGLVWFTLPLCLAGAAMHLWLARRRKAAQ